MKITEFKKGDKIEDFYYHLIFDINEGNLKKAEMTIKKNIWWYNRLKPEAKEEIKQSFKKISDDIKYISTKRKLKKLTRSNFFPEMEI